tara:strand:- start:162 stop:671 length:510 start_codon:yes stop_codon:yes gene_type:complete
MNKKATKGYYIKQANQKRLEKYGALLDIPHCKPSASLYLDILLDEHFAAIEKKEAKKAPKAELTVSEPVFNFKNELLALGADKQKVSDWMIVRKDKKASNTETALKGFLTEVNKAGISVAEAVKVAAESSWSGFKASWHTNIIKDANKGKSILQQSSESNWEEGINDIF